MLTKQGFGPATIALAQGRGGGKTIVDVVITAVAIALIEDTLKVKHDLGISGTQGDREHRQTSAEGDAKDRQTYGIPNPPDPGQVSGLMGRHDSFLADGEEPIAASEQVDLDRTCSPQDYILALLKIKPLAVTGEPSAVFVSPLFFGAARGS
jgi:hypothetical protein